MRDAGGRRARAARQDRRCRSAAANRCASRWSSARARSDIFFPAAPSTRSTSGSSSRRSTIAAACCCTAARSKAATAPVDPGAHFYRSLQLDERGNPINKRNAWMTRSVAYVRLVPPGAADTVHYRLQIPDDAGDRISLRAKVNYRKFAWWNTQWAYAGVRDPQQPAPAVTRGVRRWALAVHRRHVEGLRRDQGDSGHSDHGDGESQAIARRRRTRVRRCLAVRAVSRRVGPRALERLRHRPAAAGRSQGGGGGVPEGDRDGSRLRRRPGERRARAAAGRQRRSPRSRCSSRRSTIDPQLAKTHYFLGTALKTLGRYDEALQHLRERRRAVPARPRRARIRSAASSSCSGGSTKRSRPSSACCSSTRRICRPTTT